MQLKYLETRIKRKRIRLFISPKHKKLTIEGPLGNIQIFSKFLKNNITFIPSLAMANSFYKRIRHWCYGLIYGFFIEMKTEGVGLKFLRYYAAPQLISFSFGFSHTILFNIPKAIKFRCLKYKILLFSPNLQELRNTALRIRSYRPPDPYKGKGVKFSTEGLKLKPGKQRQR